jgi:DNA-binding SARP family transcriptional activator
VPLDRRRMRALLAYLLLHANELVSSDRLIDEVWGPEPAKTATASLQNYVSRLRKAIGADLLLSQPPGYVLRIDPERFDLARFERLTAEAHGAEPRERAEKLRAALSLWRGAALEDLAFEPFARDEIGRLEEARLAALEERIDADLELGSAGELVGELEELVEEQPLRERFRAQLMLALYRAGRQAEALEAYQEARRVLMDELGLEPSEELRSLQQSILRHDASLGATAAAVMERGPDRRTVTILFCDLVDSTALAGSLDPEVYRALMSKYFEAVRGPIERHGGTLEKFIGDAVMAVFGVPQLHEDDPLRAVRAARDIQDALADFPDGRLEARIGLSTGEVHVLSSPGEALHVSGAAASVASQLEARAPVGGVLLSDATCRLVRDAVQARPHGDAWLLVEVRSDAPGYARRLDTPLVGREAELGRLRAVYASACADRHCRVVTVVGEAGIGKTRLARELFAPLRDEAQVLVGRCVSYGEGATYLPIVEIVQQAASEQSVAAIRALLGDDEDADAVAQRVAELVGIVEAPAAPGETFWAVRRLLEAIARERPIVVALDDIHWAEPTLLDLVEYLGEWAEGPILVVCLARPDLLETRSGWGGPTSTGFLVQLEPLSPDVLGTLVQQLTDKPVDPEVQETIVQQSGGNALFAEQLLAAAIEMPDLVFERPPASVEALLASRLDRLDPRELGVLRRASVLGRGFSPAELDDLAPDGDSGRQLARLMERGLVDPRDDRFRFHHILVRDVAYRSIPKAERSELHELAARGLDRRDGADELVGYHFEQAFVYLRELSGPEERIQELAQEGGRRLGRGGIRAWKRADAPAAVNLLSRAVGLLPNADEFKCELGTALRASNEMDRAEAVLREAVEAPEPVTQLRARIELAFVRSLRDPDRVGELLDVASGAIPMLETVGDDRALGRAWLCIGYVRGGFYCEYAALEEASVRAAAHYKRAGWSPSTALENLGTALFFGPKPVQAALVDCARLVIEHDGDRASEANIIAWQGGLEAMQGQFDEGRRLVGRARAIYEELGLESGAVDLCGRALAAIEMLAGRPDKAAEALRASCELVERLGQTSLLATRAGALAAALYEQKQYDEAETWTDLGQRLAGADDLDAALSWQPTKARLLARRGAVKDAQLLAREAVEGARRTDSLNRQGDCLLASADIFRLAGDDMSAAALTQEAIQLYETKGSHVSAEQARASIPDAVLTEWSKEPHVGGSLLS